MGESAEGDDRRSTKRTRLMGAAAIGLAVLLLAWLAWASTAGSRHITTSEAADQLIASLDFEVDRDAPGADQRLVNANADFVGQLRDMDDDEAASATLIVVGWTMVQEGADPDDALQAITVLAGAAGVELSSDATSRLDD